MLRVVNTLEYTLEAESVWHDESNGEYRLHETNIKR